MHRLRLVLIALCLLAACDGGDTSAEPSPRSVPSSATTAAAPTQPACRNQADVVSDPAAGVGGALEVDVDGDGNDDEVFVALDERAEEGCRAFVAVDTGTEILAAPVWETGPQGGLPQPGIVALVDVNGEPGNEVIVREAAGASTEFAGLFVVTDGVLARVTIEGSSDEGISDNLFAYGGSVGHLEAVGCEGAGTIVTSFATPGNSPGDLEEGIYNVERKLFVFDGATLIDAGIQQERIPVDELGQFKEFGSGPFGTCGPPA
ncbi:MAG: hypothetical protein ACRDKT_09020 [Actinomycetota bacterium]